MACHFLAGIVEKNVVLLTCGVGGKNEVRMVTRGNSVRMPACPCSVRVWRCSGQCSCRSGSRVKDGTYTNAWFFRLAYRDALLTSLLRHQHREIWHGCVLSGHAVLSPQNTGM